MINYRYAYLLLVCDDEGICLKYDYLACNEKEIRKQWID
jgi:hypothetical protein